MNKETLTVEKDENGTIRYFNADGELHNPNGPAVVWADGRKAYFINGELHNPDGPAVVRANGHKEYWVKGNRHNPNGPAVVWADGYKAYCINGERHNPDGPAVVYPDGSKEYYINDKELTEAEFTAWQAQQSAPLHNTTKVIDGVEYTLTAK